MPDLPAQLPGGFEELSEAGAEGGLDKLVYNRGLARLFVDSADPSDFARLLPCGAFYGVTTNPVLLERAGQPCSARGLQGLVRLATEAGAEEVQLQTWGGSARELFNNGLRLSAISEEVVVKCPMTREGLEAASDLTANGASVTMTGVFAAHQALTAAAMGADYVAPYLGRMNDAGRDGAAAVEGMVKILANSESVMRVLVASLRSTAEVEALAQAGCNTFTLSPALCDELLADELSVGAAADFEAAVARLQEEAA